MLLFTTRSWAQTPVDCDDPQFQQTSACANNNPSAQSNSALQNNSTLQGNSDSQRNLSTQFNAASTVNADEQNERATSQTTRDVYTDSGGFAEQRDQARKYTQPTAVKEPLTDFQRLTQATIGHSLPIFGRELFRSSPSTFAPANQVQVPDDYVVGPGDQILVRMWGHDSFNGKLTVDRSGAIYIPQVGSIQVAGERFDSLQGKIDRLMGRTYKNFQLSVNLGQLRSIQVFVLGEALHPGSYTVSSLSTAFNALLESGGITPRGSLRRIEIRRAGKTAATLDLYDFLLRGDKSKDVTLQSGDVIFIPVVGAQVALSGSVKVPAIYELNGETSVAEALALAGGLTSTAADDHVLISRVGDHHELQALSVPFDAAGQATHVSDGDVLVVGSVLARYKDSVTIRGNVADAGRFPWHPGMHLSDIIPDRASLLTNGYWLRRNAVGVPTPLFIPEGADRRDPAASFQPARPTRLQDAPEEASFGTLAQQQAVATERTRNEETGQANSENRTGNEIRTGSEIRKGNEIRVPTPEIDWSYAVIERIDPSTLKSSLVPFNLGKLVLDHDPTQDLALQPGDIVTILSQSDVLSSIDEQTKYIKLEGEFVSSGTYSAHPGETLRDVVRRAGGVTPQAYLFGAAFTRTSARIMQQHRLDEYVNALSIQVERSDSQRLLSAVTPTAGIVNATGERDLIQQLRAMRATGRVVLEFTPESSGIDAIPAISIENGDTFTVPSRPIVVSVVGAVNGQSVFLYQSQRRLKDYLQLAGRPTRVADKKREYIIRADGSISSSDTPGIFRGKFDASVIYPGDTIVVPEKPIKPSTLREVIDYSQVFSQFALGAAAVEVLK
jgi:protein involved in polysaccharide export with SLBB domain